MENYFLVESNVKRKTFRFKVDDEKNAFRTRVDEEFWHIRIKFVTSSGL